jgi:hypothetical protein
MSVRFSKKSEKELEDLKNDLKNNLKNYLKDEIKISITRNKEDIRFIVNSNNQKIFGCTFTTSEKNLIINDVFLDTKSEDKPEKSQEENIEQYEQYRKALLKLTKKLIQPKGSKTLSTKNKPQGKHGSKGSKHGSKGSKRESKGGKKRTFRRKNKLIGGNIGLKIFSSIAFCFTCLCIYSLAVNKNEDDITLSAFGTFLGILLLVASEVARYNPNRDRNRNRNRIMNRDRNSDTPNNNERSRSSSRHNQPNYRIIPAVVEAESLAIMVNTLEEGSYVQQAVVTDEVSHNPINYVQSMLDLINNNNTGLSFFVLLNFIFTILPRRAFVESSQSTNQSTHLSTEDLEIEAQRVEDGNVRIACEIIALENVTIDIVVAEDIQPLADDILPL